jgi:putative transposase
MSTPRHRQKFKTCKRYNDPGDAHGLTFNCFQGRAFLSKPRTCEWMISSLKEARASLRFDVWAYVLMPEHCHLLIFPRPPYYDISAMLFAIKVPVTRKAKDYLQENAPESLVLMRDAQPNGKVAYRFWQRGGGYDRNFNEPKSIYAEIEYLHNNPVRRGLVARAEDWRWSSAGWYAGQRDVPLVPDFESLPTFTQI